jgi:hypothetical protein
MASKGSTSVVLVNGFAQGLKIATWRVGKVASGQRVIPHQRGLALRQRVDGLTAAKALNSELPTA